MSAPILVIFLMPLLWSAGFSLARQWAGHNRLPPKDREEKYFLVLILAPVIIGTAVLIMAQVFEIHLPAPLPLPTILDIEAGSNATGRTSPGAATSEFIDNRWPIAIAAVAALYCIVTSALTLRLMTSYARIIMSCTAARPDQNLGEGVRISKSTDIAMAWGKGIILLPQSLLLHLSPYQTDLIIRHERAHLARRDPLYFVALAWLDVVFWFNPFIRMQTRQCRLAAELDCDARVTQATPHMRGVYAETLVMALRHAAGNARQCVPAAFSPAKSGDYRMRISEIMHPVMRTGKTRLWATALTLSVLGAVGAAQLAWSQNPPRVQPVSSETLSPFFSIMPVNGRLSSGFGMRENPVTHKWSLHEGVDISTPSGMSVRAPAGGRIVRADMAQPWFGKVLEIDHGNGLVTRYMHLGDFEVKVGDIVAAGQEVAKSGNTGRSTGPHVHIGLFENGAAVDPAGRIPLPDAG